MSVAWKPETLKKRANARLAVDQNDFEDAKLCQHLTLDGDLTVVTSDMILQQCLKATIALLKELHDRSWHTRLQVYNVAEFAAVSG